MQLALNSRKRAPSAEISLMFWVLPARISHNFSLLKLALRAPSGGPILVRFWFLQCLALTSFMGLAMWIFNVARCLRTYRFPDLRFSFIMNSESIEIPVPGASMAIGILPIGLSQLLHVDLTSAGDNFVDRRPKDFFMGTSSTLQSMGHGMRLLYNDQRQDRHATTLQCAT